MADMNNNDLYTQEIEEEEFSTFNLKSIISKIVLNWYWIILFAIFCYAVASLRLRYITPVYNASVKILIKESDSRRSSSGLEELGVISNSSGLGTELEILSSAAISERVVKDLKLYVSYAEEGKIVDRELYKNAPVTVDIAENKLEDLNTNINLVISKKGNGIHVDGSLGGDAQKAPTFSQDIAQLPTTIHTAAGPLLIQKNPGHEFSNKRIFVSIHPLIPISRSFSYRLRAEQSKRGNITLVTMSETCPQRALDFLNRLVDCYNEDANESKNEVANKTEQFIKERLSVIQRELDSTEINLESFKISNKLINLPSNASAAFSSSSSYQEKRMDMQTQMTLVTSLIDYLKDPENALRIIPTNIGITSAQANSAIQEYNAKVLQRNRLIKAGSESTPSVINLTNEMENMWPIISEYLTAYYNDLVVQKQDIDSRYQIYNGQVSNTPVQERELSNITRQQEIKAGLYLMLLQKREQNFLSLASTAAKARMIDSPQMGGKISPNDKRIKMIALGFGIIFPLAIILLSVLLRYRIEGREDVEHLTKLPILADIPLYKKQEEGKRSIVVRENANDMMEETFRGLRTNLRFVFSGNEKVILCTSCIPGEGKTFVSTNLAMSFALLGKKVIVIGLDVRKPQLANIFELQNKKQGITTYLAGDTADYNLLEQQIYHSVKNANLDILPSGIIPPNPSELLSKTLLDDAINYLKGIYDYIILDTPPVGLVSDTLDLGRLADVSIFVIRADYSLKANFAIINTIKQDRKMPKVNLVLNGVDLTKRKYGYYYGYSKYGSYKKYGKYGYYGKYGHYGHYGVYGENRNPQDENNESSTE